MNNADVIAGWTGFSLALVVGYGAYKNKPVFGPKGIVSTTIQTGKIGTGGAASATAPPAPIPPLVQLPSGGLLLPGVQRVLTPPQQAVYVAPAPQVAPSAPTPAPSATKSGGILSSLGNLFKGLFGGVPTPTTSGSTIYV